MNNNIILVVYTLLNNKKITKVYNLSKNDININPSITLLKSKNIIQVDFYNYYGIFKNNNKIIKEFNIGNNVGVCDNFKYFKQIIV